MTVTITTEVPAGIEPEAYARFLRSIATSRIAANRVATVLEQQETGVEPGVAWQLAAAELLWRHLIEVYGVYDARQIAELRGAAPSNRSIATNLAKRADLIGFHRGRTKVYPRFEFKGREPHPAWRRLVRPLVEAGWESEDILLWFVSPHAALDGREPAELIDAEPDVGAGRLTEVVAEEAKGVA